MDARYPLSKLLNVLFTRALAARVAPAAPLVAACVNPGFCYSGLRRNAPRLVLVRFAIMDLLLGRAAAEGGKTLVWGALAGHGDASARDSLKGAYMSNCKAAEPSDFVLSPEGRETERRLWVGAFRPDVVEHDLTCSSGRDDRDPGEGGFTSTGHRCRVPDEISDH
jgi:retinol dehydrogenase-12